MTAVSASAKEVECMSGSLSKLLVDTDISDLTITGSMNAADFDYLNSRCTSLSRLDLTGVTIEEYSGGRLSNGRVTSPAGELPDYSLMGSPIRFLTLPETLTSMGDGCLAASCITSIVIPAGVNGIGDSAFNNAGNLTEVVINGKIDVIAPYTFKNCKSLVAITMPASLRKVSAGAFKGCEGITAINLEEVDSIGDEAFSGCRVLASVRYGESLSHIGNDAFNGTALEHVDLSGCSRLTSIGNWAFGHCGSLHSVKLPESLTLMGDGVFFDCNSLSEITLSSSLNTITPYMLKGAALTAADGVTSEGIESIGKYALYGNDMITHMKLPTGIESLGDKAMAGMKSLNRLDISLLTTLPKLGQDVFRNTAGKNVELLTTELLAPACSSAEQWKEFAIRTVDISGVETATSPETSLTTVYDGETLTVKSNRPIDTATLYDLNGCVVASNSGNGETYVKINVDTKRGNMILRIGYKGDDIATMKIGIF
ncbi:MAG: leucine-rich repeat domain-containing protein [Clostridiales bacterium]|nr:leucine-rich repeat domain-containing protein [Clostridiales bacterium]